MDERFEHIDLKNERVNKIINAAFEVFSKNDLEKASTNTIVKTAGVSRGLLYHYFKDKEELFDFLIYFSIKAIVTDMEKQMNWENTDFLNRIRDMIFLKFHVIQQYPYMMEFFEKYSEHISKREIKNQKDEMVSNTIKDLYTYNVDFSGVKEDVDLEKMIDVIKWTLKGKAEEHWKVIHSKGIDFDVNELIKECDEYIQFLRYQFYK